MRKYFIQHGTFAYYEFEKLLPGGIFVLRVISQDYILPNEEIQGQLVSKELESYTEYKIGKNMGLRDEYLHYNCTYQIDIPTCNIKKSVTEKSEFKASEIYKDGNDDLGKS